MKGKKKATVTVCIAAGIVLACSFLLYRVQNPYNKANGILKKLYSDYCKIEEILLCADVDMDKLLLEENGNQYYAVVDNYDCKTMKQFEELLEKVYTKEKIAEISERYINGEGAVLKSVNGKLARIPADAPITTFGIPIIRAEEVNKNEIEAIAAAGEEGQIEISIVLKREGQIWKIEGVNFLN